MNVELNEELEVVATAGTVDCVDSARVFDVVDKGIQLGWCIRRKPYKGRFLPQAGEQVIAVVIVGKAIVTAVRVAGSALGPKCVGTHRGDD